MCERSVFRRAGTCDGKILAADSRFRTIHPNEPWYSQPRLVRPALGPCPLPFVWREMAPVVEIGYIGSAPGEHEVASP